MLSSQIKKSGPKRPLSVRPSVIPEAGWFVAQLLERHTPRIVCAYPRKSPLPCSLSTAKPVYPDTSYLSLSAGRRTGRDFLAHIPVRFPTRPTLERPASRPKSSLRHLNNTCESCCVCYSQICEDFSVQSDVGLFKPFHETIVRETVDTGTRADPCDPEAAKIPLLCPAIAVSVAKGPFYGLLRLFQSSAAATDISFGRLHDLVSSGPTGRCTSCSGHYWLLGWTVSLGSALKSVSFSLDRMEWFSARECSRPDHLRIYHNYRA
jgi:hypothetical protein